MREIKFRVWNSQKTENTIISFRNTGWINMCDETNGGIDQFTGLLDKNGKELFEGDIVKYEDEKKTVVWEKGAWGLEATPRAVLFADWYYETELCEIIGNIYENGDLLSPNKQ